MRPFLIFRSFFVIIVPSRLKNSLPISLFKTDGIIFVAIQGIDRLLTIDAHIESTVFIVGIMQFLEPTFSPPFMLFLQVLNPLLSFPQIKVSPYEQMRYCYNPPVSAPIQIWNILMRSSFDGRGILSASWAIVGFQSYNLLGALDQYYLLTLLAYSSLYSYHFDYKFDLNKIMKQTLKYDHQMKKDLIGKITYHEQLNVDSKNRGIEPPSNKRVFILLTGGTIGMFPNSEGKYAPARNRFISFLKKYQYFCDEDETYFNGKDGFIITPPSIAGYPISYKYFQLEDLIDSTNMSIDRLNMILTKIEEVYDKYDAFIILHGTDTMAYTASALSFMIENLKKTVIITGAQIPMGQPRNDAVNNLLSSLTIAGHYSIPEVLVIFDNKILRGNRTTKFSTASFQAFKSPNFYPLGELGLSVSIKWQKILPCNQELSTNFIRLQEQVQIQKLTPFGYNTPPSSKYVVIESFGIGNIPTEGPFYDWAVQNSKLPQKQRKVLVNISQVFQSVIKNTYQTGQMAFKLGMIPGSDMTCEAAISKLSYLVTKGFKKFEELNEMMRKNLRGELTQQQDRFTKQKQNYALNCMTVLDRHFSSRTKKQKQILIQVIFPTIIFEKPSRAVLNRLEQYNFDAHKIFPDGSNLVHRVMRIKHHNMEADYDLVLDLLLKENVNINLIDNSGNSPVFYGIKSQNYQAVGKLMEKGGLIKTTASSIFKAIAREDFQLLRGLIRFGDKFDYTNNEGRNCAFITIIKKHDKMIDFFREYTSLFQQEGLNRKDIYGYPLSHYVKKFGYEKLFGVELDSKLVKVPEIESSTENGAKELASSRQV